MSLKEIKDVSYFKLNNEINRPVDGQIPLHKDKEALAAFFKENVEPNTMTFDTVTDKINYLIEHDYLEEAFIRKYRPAFISFYLNSILPSSPSWQRTNFILNMH